MLSSQRLWPASCSAWVGFMLPPWPAAAAVRIPRPASNGVVAIHADGSEITTVQRLADGELHPAQKAFHENRALQCGYCTSAAAQASESLDLTSTVAMPVLKRLAPVVAGLMLGLIFGMLLGQRPGSGT
jgi:hypothetical protein